MERYVPGLMGRLLDAVIVVALGGFAFFLIGQLLPRRIYRPDAFPYRPWKWENSGKIYTKIGVHLWKDHMPDMSRIIPGMVKKKAQMARTPETMWMLILETCGAEFIHDLLIIFISPMVYAAIRGFEGVIAAVIYALGNLLFVIIQRYNRPRLVEIHKRMEKRREKCS